MIFLLLVCVVVAVAIICEIAGEIYDEMGN